MAKVRARLLALAFMGWAGFAHALSLGEIEVKSRLNQPLAASIPVSGSTAEIGTIEVSLATNEDFERAGIERAEFLSSLRFEVTGKSIRVWSKDLAREPFVSFLLEVRSGSARLLREYTVLLDPPTLAQGSDPRPVARVSPPAEAPAAAPAVQTQPGIAEAPAVAPQDTEEPAAPAPAPSATEPARVTYEGEQYGPVGPRETLWSIAYRLRPDPSLTMDQMQVAIFNANPEAFHEGRINGLMKGVILRIPSSTEIRAIDPVAAKSQVAAARAAPATGTGSAPVAPATATPSQAEAPPADSQPEPAPAPAEVQAPASEPPPSDELPPTASDTTPEPEQPAETPPATAEPGPIETQPAPVAASPPPEDPGLAAQLLGQGRALLDHPLVIPAVAGIVLLLIVLMVVNLIRKRYAKWAYTRASRQSPKTPAFSAAAAVGQDFAESAPLDEGAGDTPTLVAPPPPIAATQVMGAATMQQTMQQTQVQEPPQASTGGGPKLDYDVTGNFANETVQVNLDAGDPVSEAEFHRAYGLYDEAALLLKQALQKDPQRLDAHVKLAEIYFEAGKPKDFVEIARDLKGKLPDDEWQKIVLLGTQIAPDEAMFQGGAGASTGRVDLSFDEPASAAAPAAPAAPAADAGLEFSLEDVQLPETPAAPAAPARPADGDSLEFDLGNLSLDIPADNSLPAAAPAASDVPSVDDVKLDLGDFDLQTEAPRQGTPPSGGEVVDLGGDFSMDDPSAAPGDEASTKLDLARAYIDMGDHDMARSLLNEVAQQGNDSQMQEARELLKRVPA